VLLRFPWLAAELKAQGADAELMAPVRGVLRAEGEILLDHSFTGGLRGSCKVESHKMFSSQDLIEVLPGRRSRTAAQTKSSTSTAFLAVFSAQKP
jgi:hypothetical protein